MTSPLQTGVFNYLELDRVHFGTPAAEALQTEASQRGAQRIFVVTSKSLHRKTDAVTAALSRIQPQVVGLFDDCVEHTPRESVIAVAQAVRAAQADLIVSIGGGTVIDTVKVALVALAEDLDSIEQLDDWHMRVAPDGSRITPQPRTPPCRQIAVPTTLSGAEFSDLGGCTDTRFGTKQGYTGAFIGAAAVILDPRITVHTPDAAVAVHRRAGGRPCGGSAVQHQRPAADRRHQRAGAGAAGALAQALCQRPGRPGRTAGRPAGRLAGRHQHPPHRLWRQPRPGPCAGR